MSTPHPGDYARVHAPTSIRESGAFKVLSIKDGVASLAKPTVWEDTKSVMTRPLADLIKTEPEEMDLLGYSYFPYLQIVTDRVRGGETFDQSIKRLPNMKAAPKEVRDLLRELVGKERGISRVGAAKPVEIDTDKAGEDIFHQLRGKAQFVEVTLGYKDGDYNVTTQLKGLRYDVFELNAMSRNNKKEYARYVKEMAEAEPMFLAAVQKVFGPKFSVEVRKGDKGYLEAEVKGAKKKSPKKASMPTGLRVAAAHEERVVVAGVKETGRFTTGQIDLEYRRLWDRAATRAEIAKVAIALDIDPDDYDETENDWVDAASEAFDLPNGDILSLDDDDADGAKALWADYANTVHREAEDDNALDRFITHVGSALWPEGVLRTAKTTGDGKSVGFFLPVPDELAAQFPSLGKEDTSPPHVTLLYVGEVPKAREKEFISVATEALAKQPGPVIATIGAPDFFVHPEENRRVWYSAVTFSKDVAELRDRLWLALEGAGFTVEDARPLAYTPHITLAYVNGEAHEHSAWKGNVPGGAWSFDSVAVWGLTKDVEVFLGEFDGGAFADVAKATVVSRVASNPVPPTGGECKVLDQTADRVYWQAKSGSKTYWLITNYAGVIDQDAPLSGHQQGNYFKKRDGDAAWAQVKSAQRVATHWAAGGG